MKLKIKLLIGIIAVAIAGTAVYFSSAALQRGAEIPFGRRADYLIENGIALSLQIPREGEQIVFTSKISNRGRGKKKDIKESSARLEIDGIEVPPDNITSPLDANVSENESWTLAGGLTAGNHSARVCADSKNEIEEISEINNCHAISLFVHPSKPDFVIDSFEILIGANNQTGYRGAIRNTGAGFTSPMYVYYKIFPVYADGTVKTDTYFIGSAPAFTEGGTFLIPDTYKLTNINYFTNNSITAFKIVFDENNGVAESNETNNTRTAPIPPEFFPPESTEAAAPSDENTVPYTPGPCLPEYNSSGAHNTNSTDCIPQ